MADGREDAWVVRTTRAPGRRRARVRAACMVIVLTCLSAMVPLTAFASDTSAPSEPGNITISNLTATSVSLSWGGSRDANGIEGYRVWRGPASGRGMDLITTTDATTSYVSTNLRSGRTYTFGVTAIDAANNQSPMRAVLVTILPNTADRIAPAAPLDSSVSFRVFSSSRVDLVWGSSVSADVSGYRVLRNGLVVGEVDLPNTPRFSDNGLAASTSYTYSIQTVDSAGNISAASTPKTVTTPVLGTPFIVRGPYISRVTGDSAVISWWTNLTTFGTVSIGGRLIPDPAGNTQHHSVTVTRLARGASYPFTVKSKGVTASGVLRTAAIAGQTFSFAAIGDFGGGSIGEFQNAANIARDGTQFIQTVGDDVYPSSGLPDPNFSKSYSDFDQRFFRPFGTVLTSQAYFPANGNKEYYDNGEFWKVFPMPGGLHTWYNYNWGNAHILVLDTEQSIAPGSPQYNYAKADLAGNQKATWRIVVLQRPPYSSVSVNSSSKSVQQFLVPVFQSQHVSLVLSGNSHNYERTYPLINGARAAGGVTYVVTGAGGNSFNPFRGAPPAYSAVRECSYYEFAKVTVSPTALTVQAVRADTNTVFDSTVITR